MQAASREALATSNAQLDAATRDAGGEELSRLADDLLGFARVLLGEPTLRRALSDPSRREGDRAALAEGIFAAHLGEPAMSVLSAMVTARWSVPNDLVDAAELLGIEAVLIGAEREDVLADVEDELFRFERIVEGHPTLGAALGDETAAAQRRDVLVDDLLEGKARPASVRLARLAVGGVGGRGFESSLDRLVELAAARRNRSVVRVRVAAPLTEEQERGLAEALADGYHRQMSLQIEVDESLVGGAVVRVGSDLYDGSIARRLAEARRHLTSQ